MSFMDKVKAQAEQAKVKGQQAVAQGQTKLNDMQAGKSNDQLLRDLGTAYYAHQRSGGPTDAIDAAMAALDAHAAAAAQAAAAAAAPPPPPPASGPAPSILDGMAPPAGPAQPAPGAPAAPAQSFGLDDV